VIIKITAVASFTKKDNQEQMSEQGQRDILSRFERLNSIGVALSAERDLDRLLEMILDGAQEITGADGGTLYTMNDRNELEFQIVRTKSLGLKSGGISAEPVPFKPLPLYKDGEPNLHMIAAYVAIRQETINIEDAYDAEGFDFSGTKAFDENTGYHSKSFLTLPMKNHQGEVIGVLQLINAINPATGEVERFSDNDQRFAESLASQAAVALTNSRLIEEQRLMFESFIQLIAAAIDEKSPYTGGHCNRVPELTLLIAKAISDTSTGPLADFKMDESDIYELKIAGWLHDCGKVTTPEYVVDKATKLETIYDRINLVDTRFEVLKRDVMIDALGSALQKTTDLDPQEVLNADAVQDAFRELDEERDFLHHCNVGGEFMSEEYQDRVKEIAKRGYQKASGEHQALLTENEVYNLNIPKGTLTPEEREVINNHIVMTIKMLEALPFPKHLANVPEYAGGHHERMDGKGYPRGLTRDQMSVQARVMGIADIFEALTAGDRPYKDGKTLTEALRILGFMKQDNHIDPDIFDIFIRNKVYMDYAQKFLAPEQITSVNESEIPGYTP
jgi:HD-GYP domain-containing protein (c-di-GMP phosphodiesterase class II)